MDDYLKVYINLVLTYLQKINEVGLEFAVYRLLKISEKPMTLEEIIDELFFIGKIDEERLEFILNYYDFIHFDGERYYYSEEEKSIEDNIISIMYKIIEIEKMDLNTLVSNLLFKKGRPLHIDEILDFLNVVVYVEEDKLIRKLANEEQFKLVGYKTYALTSWEEYKDFYCDFDRDILNFRRRSRTSSRDWEMFKKYKLFSEQTTLQDIGDIYDITRERVRQIIEKVDRKVRHPNYKKQFKKYITFVEELIDEYGVVCLKYENDIRQFGKAFNNWNPIEAINLLNIIENKFVVIEDKYIYTIERYEYILHYLDYIVEKEKLFVGSKELDIIYDELKMEKWREKEFLKMIINRDKRFYIDRSEKLCYFSQKSFDKYSLLYLIFEKIGEPIHYSIIMKEYMRITGDKTEPRLILSYFDRRRDLFVRVFTGTYALKKWGYDEHVFVVDLVVKLLEEKQCAMHYHDIYNCIKDKTMAKERTMYALMQSDDRIVSLGHGFYGLASQIKNGDGDIKYYSNIIDEDNDRRMGYLLGKYTNEYGNVIIIYRIVDTILNSYSIKIPKLFNINLNRDIYAFDKDHNRYGCLFNDSENNLYGINRFLKRKELSEGDIIVLEFISSNIIRMFTKYEYENEYEVFDFYKYGKYIDVVEEVDDDNNDPIEISDVDSLLKFGLNNGYVYYEDLENINISEKYDDIFELMMDFNERGITFLNKD